MKKILDKPVIPGQLFQVCTCTRVCENYFPVFCLHQEHMIHSGSVGAGLNSMLFASSVSQSVSSGGIIVPVQYMYMYMNIIVYSCRSVD